MIAERAGLNMTVVYYWAFDVLFGIDTSAADSLALSEMRRQWGNMLLPQDIDTLWERYACFGSHTCVRSSSTLRVVVLSIDFSFSDSESCHNYGAVPAYFLSAYVLGVRVSGGPVHEPGTLRIEPRLGDISGASGAVVTELGVVNCSWSRNATVLSFTVSLPAVPGVVPLRLADTNGSTLILNGKLTQTTSDGRYSVAMISGPGSYSGSILYVLN